ncbi:MAG: MotE family protein [Desulfosalsimonas sp.]
MKTGIRKGFVLFVTVFAALVFLLPGGASAEKPDVLPEVLFDCEDIGVEARRMLSRLEKQRSRFAEKQEELSRRENELKNLEEEVDEKLERLKELRREVKQMLDEKEMAEEERAKKLSRIYQKRDPGGAARSLAEMEKDLAVSVLSMMRDKYAGEILDNMEQSVAVEYSTELGRLRQ